MIESNFIYYVCLMLRQEVYDLKKKKNGEDVFILKYEVWNYDLALFVDILSILMNLI